MDRQEAAALLGITIDADPAAVRRAWRFWARIAHPDVGGDPDHFARLQQARQVMLRPRPIPMQEPAPRPTLRAVFRRPAHPRSLSLTAFAALLMALLPHYLAAPLAVTAAPAALAATAWASWAMRELLRACADRGHRIETLALLWFPMVLGQLTVSLLGGTSLLPVLPLFALPIAGAVAALNPGAGLWRPATQQDPDGPRTW